MGIVSEELLDYFLDHRNECRALDLLDEAVRVLGKIELGSDRKPTKRILEAKEILKEEATRIREENYDHWGNIMYRASQLESRRWWEGWQTRDETDDLREAERRVQDYIRKPGDDFTLRLR